MGNINRVDPVSGLALTRTRNLIEHAVGRPSDDRTPGVVIWGENVYEDGVLLGLVFRDERGFDRDEHEIDYLPAVRAAGSAT